MYSIILIAVVIGLIIFFLMRSKETPITEKFKKRRENMTDKERMQEQITIELEQSARTDSTVVRTAILLNMILLAANSSVAAAASGEGGAVLMILMVLIAVVIVINVVVARALSRGKERRVKLTEALKKLFQEGGMDEIYDSTLIEGYKTRYDMFTTVVISLGVAAVVIPLIALVACEGL
jgi:Na+-driven multidrug efflux pump